MIVRKIIYASGGIKTIYLEFPEKVEQLMSMAIRNNRSSSIKKLITEVGGRIYSKNVICKLKIKGK